MSSEENSSRSLSGTIGAQLKFNAATFGTRAAVLSEGEPTLSHEALHERVVETIRTLRRLNIQRGDRVAIVLPQGPELAVTFLAVAAGATAAPLNASYREDDFDFNLRDIDAKALIVLQGDDSPAVAAAKKFGIAIIEVERFGQGAGLLFVAGMPVGPNPAIEAGTVDWAETDDIALVLHTSGTTSRPKRVPLSHANLCASARHIAATLSLGPEDVSLSVMPLFHIHGLGCLLAALWASGSCVCIRSFQAARFAGWLDRFEPTWVSAVPTMLQAILEASEKPAFTQALTHSLRLIRSSSAALPRPIMAGLEAAYQVPVIEAYGMTEASHQMASNPLPPRQRKAGSVGLPAGPRIAILDAQGALLTSGVVGEVAIAGANVTSGYENRPEANAEAFSGEWFRTGDQGYLDDEGYLFLTGRLKELINRGGEKIVPREIDDVLVSHPSVREAVAFAVPHESLGEDVAAAVVLTGPGAITEAALRDFLFAHLAAFKVPSRVVVVDALPRGPTGKIQRIGMAARLAHCLTEHSMPPATGMESTVADAIKAVLGRESVGRDDNFFMLGGDSLRGVQVVARLRETLNLELPVASLFRLPTVALLAARIEEMVAASEIDSLSAALGDLSPDEQVRVLEEAGLDFHDLA